MKQQPYENGKAYLKAIQAVAKETLKAIDTLAPKVGQVDWKFGLITRTIFQDSPTRYSIHDLSGGWVSAIVTKPTLIKIIKGEKDLSTLNWK